MAESKLLTPTDNHNWLLKKWRKPGTFIGNYENDGIYVMRGKFNPNTGNLREEWNVPAGLVFVEHEISENGQHAKTVSLDFWPHDCE